jgi:hypothetical protein
MIQLRDAAFDRSSRTADDARNIFDPPVSLLFGFEGRKSPTILLRQRCGNSRILASFSASSLLATVIAIRGDLHRVEFV